jgi:hypothetical protein
MMRRAFLQFVLTALLLVGQQGAISHAVWHLHDFFPAHEHSSGHHDGQASGAHDHEGDEPSSQAELCDLHLAFGTLLSVGGAAQPAVLLADLASVAVPSPSNWRVAPPRVAFHSRAPPVLL